MEKRHYELLFITRHISEDKAENYFADYLAMFRKDGEVIRYENWGVRNLAYRIDDVSKGAYILANIYCLPKVIEEVEKRCKFDEMILRYMVIRMNEGITEDSPIKKMQSLKKEHTRDDDTRPRITRSQDQATDKTPKGQNNDAESQDLGEAKEEDEAAPASAEGSADQPADTDGKNTKNDDVAENVENPVGKNDDSTDVNIEEEIEDAKAADSAPDSATEDSPQDTDSSETEENK